MVQISLNIHPKLKLFMRNNYYITIWSCTKNLTKMCTNKNYPLQRNPSYMSQPPLKKR